MEGWVKPKAAAIYCDVCERTFRPWLKNGLRHVRLPSGTILIKYKWIDEFLEKYEVGKNNDVERVVEEICQELKG